jgi:hypothetical protein
MVFHPDEGTWRTQIDKVKSAGVLKPLVEAHGIDPMNTAAMARRFPKFFRGGRVRITVLRHFYQFADDPTLPEALLKFHDRPDWQTAREGEALAKAIVELMR